MIARIAIAAALAGSAIGAAAVLADDHSAPNVPAVAPAKTTPQDTRPPLKARDITIDVQANDPKGGPPWAVRRFTAGTPESECAELGRIVNGTFGWIDGYGTFRPARAGRHEAPDLCEPPLSLKRIGAQVIPTTTVVYRPGVSPQPSRGVAWGLAAPGIRAIRPQGGPELDVTRRNTFLAVTTTPPPANYKGQLIRNDGSIRRYDYGPEYPNTFIAPTPGTTRVAIEAPDPAGGQPWAILVADGPHGELCRSQEGRLLGGRLGVIQRPLDIFNPLFGEIFCRRQPREPTPAYPLRITYGLWGEGFGDDSSGHVERRVLRGRVSISGQVDPSVVSVTLRTPRDVRTLVPSQPDHLILAVYEGTFPTGEVTAVAHLSDGRDVTRRMVIR
jgi:hypothetical protein